MRGLLSLSSASTDISHLASEFGSLTMKECESIYQDVRTHSPEMSKGDLKQKQTDRVLLSRELDMKEREGFLGF